VLRGALPRAGATRAAKLQAHIILHPHPQCTGELAKLQAAAWKELDADGRAPYVAQATQRSVAQRRTA
jgi:hypothetical protein